MMYLIIKFHINKQLFSLIGSVTRLSKSFEISNMLLTRNNSLLLRLKYQFIVKSSILFKINGIGIWLYKLILIFKKVFVFIKQSDQLNRRILTYYFTKLDIFLISLYISYLSFRMSILRYLYHLLFIYYKKTQVSYFLNGYYLSKVFPKISIYIKCNIIYGILVDTNYRKKF